METEGLISSKHSIYFIYCSCNMGNTWHSSTVAQIFWTGLTMSCHNCVLVVRLLGLPIQNPGSVNTSKDSKMKTQWKKTVKSNYFIALYLANKKCLSRRWENLSNIPLTLVHLFNAHRHFLQTVGENPYKHLRFVVTSEGVFFSRTAVFFGSVRYLHPLCNKKPVFCHLLYGELLGFEKKWWKHDQGFCDFKSH